MFSQNDPNSLAKHYPNYYKEKVVYLFLSFGSIRRKLQNRFQWNFAQKFLIYLSRAKPGRSACTTYPKKSGFNNVLLLMDAFHKVLVPIYSEGTIFKVHCISNRFRRGGGDLGRGVKSILYYAFSNY